MVRSAYMWLTSRNTKTGCLLSKTRQAGGVLLIFLTMPAVQLLIAIVQLLDSNSTIIILTVTQGKITNVEEFVSLNFLDC